MDYLTYREKLQNHFPEPLLAFTPDEYEARLASVRQKMVEAKLDVLLLTEASELCYLTGYTTFEVSVQCVLLVASDKTVLFVPAIEMGPAVYLSRVDDVIGYPWQSPEAVASDLAVQVRRTAGSTAPRIGFDPWAGSFRPGLLAALKNTLDTATFIDFGALVDRVRLVKSPAELAYLAESAAITNAGLDAAAAVTQAGVVDHEIVSAILGRRLDVHSDRQRGGSGRKHGVSPANLPAQTG